MAACVHPDGPTDRARYPDRPLEPREAGRRSAPREHRVSDRPARPDEVGLDLDAGEAVAEPHAQPREAAV